MLRIYYMNLEGDCSKEQSFSLQSVEMKMLPKERQESVRKAKNEEVARKRLYTGVFLQQVLSKELGVSTEQLQYKCNEWGKPELDVEGILSKLEMSEGSKGSLSMDKKRRIQSLQFNLSHSGKYAVLAISDQSVGIDIEHKRKNGLSLAKRCFCEAEYEDIMSLEKVCDQEKRFLEYWTMKEAYIKQVGEGLRIPLNSFLIKRGENGISTVEGKDIFLATREFAEGYVVSVCSEALEDAKECFAFDE